MSSEEAAGGEGRVNAQLDSGPWVSMKSTGWSPKSAEPKE